MEITEVDKLLIQILIAPQRNDEAWDNVADYFGRLVEAAEETMIVEWPSVQIKQPKPYVQMRKDISGIYFEALSDFYVRDCFPPDTANSLSEFGWLTPDPESEECRNFYIEFYGDSVDYKMIGHFIAKTFRYGYACSLEDKYEVGPDALAKKVKFVTLSNQSGPRFVKEGE